MIIRCAKIEDSKSISELLEILGYPQDEAFVIDKMMVHSNVSSCIFVAENGTEVLGFVSVHMIPIMHAKGCLGKITALSVYPKYQRQGVGSILVKTAEQYAITQGAVRFEVISGNSRKAAHCFYKKAGFEKTAQSRFTKDLDK